MARGENKWTYMNRAYEVLCKRKNRDMKHEIKLNELSARAYRLFRGKIYGDASFEECVQCEIEYQRNICEAVKQYMEEGEDHDKRTATIN